MCACGNVPQAHALARRGSPRRPPGLVEGSYARTPVLDLFSAGRSTALPQLTSLSEPCWTRSPSLSLRFGTLDNAALATASTSQARLRAVRKAGPRRTTNTPPLVASSEAPGLVDPPVDRDGRSETPAFLRRRVRASAGKVGRSARFSSARARYSACRHARLRIVVADEVPQAARPDLSDLAVHAHDDERLGVPATQPAVLLPRAW